MDDEDDMSIAELMRKRAAERAAAAAFEDDDITIAELMRRRAAEKAARIVTKPPQTKSVSSSAKVVPKMKEKIVPRIKEEQKQPKEEKKEKRLDKPKPSSSSSGNKSKSVGLYEETMKGMLIQKLLVRWWYAIDWPGELQGEPPAGYEPLDGIKGVFVGTRVSICHFILAYFSLSYLFYTRYDLINYTF